MIRQGLSPAGYGGCDVYVSAGSALRASRSGSFFATQVSSKIMVSPFSAVYFGQFGSPVRWDYRSS
jgi:hypothetical protein